MNKRCSRILLMVLILPGFLLGCGRNPQPTPARLGMIGINSPGRMNYKFQVFNGVEKANLNLSQGDVLNISCQVALSQGSLEFALLDAQGSIVWRIAQAGYQQNQEKVTIQTTGAYIFQVTGKNAGGSFDLYWQVLE